MLRRWSHLILGGALLMPFFLLMTALVPIAFEDANPFRNVIWEFVAFGAALPVAAFSALVFPPVRTLEAVAVRSLCDLPEERADQLADGPAQTWAARWRTALWFVAHLLAGGIVSGMTLSAPPAAVVLLLLPVTPLVDLDRLGRPAIDGVLGPLLGLALLGLVVGTAWGAGALLARCAPVLLGPTPGDRLAAAERRAADLASRNRLARELHDSVGHALSAVTLQASAARRVLDADADFVRQALAAIEETTREAVAELDTVLGLLREEDGSQYAPAPALDGLDGLLDRTRAAGVRVEATVDKGCGRLAPVVSREAYRIVQEGLSNALRHAGPVPVRLRITVREEELHITMENPLASTGGRGPMEKLTALSTRDISNAPDAPDMPDASTASGGPPTRPGGGHGLHGIAERAHLLGGHAQAGVQDGVWVLTARLPLGATR
ncbi:histidine kinase [Streptomyces sp. MST-110588]|uniref:sensor histidine kinase n=1 Tax=Streptomyces sp. MST-110588 TaxID=2833628 RepID=UPI001F5D9DBD|nr:histidine kinase [Streptomyces sp. MST-110588]UNO44258.1 histidine kinase [Streptomyces sp. MST-110588]